MFVRACSAKVYENKGLQGLSSQMNSFMRLSECGGKGQTVLYKMSILKPLFTCFILQTEMNESMNN